MLLRVGFGRCCEQQPHLVFLRNARLSPPTLKQTPRGVGLLRFKTETAEANLYDGTRKGK
jgi:hypothetical protein